MNKKKILHDLEELEAADTEEMDRLVFGDDRKKRGSGKNSRSISRK
ncbi:MAG: hypothetical protein ACYCSO_10460 [Cuniculiplasma sp.]